MSSIFGGYGTRQEQLTAQENKASGLSRKVPIQAKPKRTKPKFKYVQKDGKIVRVAVP